MSCAINPFLMAHQWRKKICAIKVWRVGKTNGANGAPLGFSNSAPMAQMAHFSRPETPHLPGKERAS
jgi:hypothetical protein